MLRHWRLSLFTLLGIAYVWLCIDLGIYMATH